MEKLIVIKTLAELDKLKSYLHDKDFVAYDTETTGVEKDSEIIGYSIAAEPEVGYYVILKYWDTKTQSLVSLETTKGTEELLDILLEKQLVMHNGLFDCWMTKNNFDIDLMPNLHTDTMLLAHLLDENRSVGLKELGVAIHGESARQEQKEMKESVERNGGQLTKNNYELFKADADLLAKYGAKDAILTLKIFFELVPQLYEQELDGFFYDDETMPLLRGPTYDLNTTGLRVEPTKLQNLKGTLEAECLEAKAFIHKEIAPHVKAKYPGTSAAKTFNIGSGKQLAWLLYFELGNEFNNLTKSGREVCKYLGLRLPYYRAAKNEFIQACIENKGRIYCEAGFNPKTGKMSRPKKVADPWHYIAAGKESLGKLSGKYKWVQKLLEYKKSEKLLKTYVEGIQSRMKYNVIRPNFLQHGTTSGRYSCKNPNFTNLPRDDKRIKACVVSRPGKVFVGADYSQLEPRVFASVSQDDNLLACFARGEDFYSVVGAPIFGKSDCSMFKEDKNSFAKKYPQLRDRAKVIALATPYGRTAMQQSSAMGISVDEAQDLIDKYFAAYPKVELMMLERHEQAKSNGVVHSLFGRPRRMPEAMKITKIYGDLPHGDLPYAARNLLNLAMNHSVQSTAASITNRAMIDFMGRVKDAGLKDCHIVLMVHDEIVAECLEQDQHVVAGLLKVSMESAASLPGVSLIAEPKVGNNLAELK